MFLGNILSILQMVHISIAQSTVRVSTINGMINGIVAIKGNDRVNQFLNVPYAEPPVGALRFKKPIAKKRWNNVYDAQAYGPSCLQRRQRFVNNAGLPNTNMSEDCLSLNIYVPGYFSSAHQKSVMIFVHGGGFRDGEGQLYDGSNLALNGDVIVVSINYRLGVFGFLSTGDQEAEGNYGLWDQLLAFRWVRQNIYAFGGNPHSITIFGQSAGAYSVGMHLFSPESDGLFQRVIGESGTPFTPSFVQTTGDIASKTTKALANVFNCPSSDNPTSETMTCLRNVPAENLLKVTLSQPSMMFGPVVDGQIITDYPERMLSNKSSKAYQLFSSRDILFGVNSGEGGISAPALSRFVNISDGISADEFCQQLFPMMTSGLFNGNPKIANASCERYKNNTDINAQSMKVLNFFGDMNIVSPAVKLLRMHSPTPKATYQYLFSQPTNLFLTPLPSWYTGANHGDELGFVFGLLNLNPKTLPGDQTLSELMMTYWTNFAKYGDPNGTNKQGSATTPFWPSYNVNESYIDLSHSPTVEQGLFEKRMHFWLDTVPTLTAQSNTNTDSVFG